MRKILTALLWIAVQFSYAQTAPENHSEGSEPGAARVVKVSRSMYSGGMLFFQPGFTRTENDHQTIRDGSSAIGGILRLYFAKNWTAGIYGGSQKTSYESAASTNSYIQLGYGGPFIGFSKQTGKVRFTASAFAGMGSVRNLHIESQNGTILTDADLYKYAALVYTPILSLDYAMTPKISLTVQALCLTARYDKNKLLYNPTLQIGILFNR